MIPVKYTVRNLRARWVTTVMTALGTAVVVWASVLSFGLADGLETALRISADELDVICLRKGSLDEVSSGLSAETAGQIATLEGISLDPRGRPLCSEEFLITVLKTRRGTSDATNLAIRGLTDVGRALRPGFRIVAGRDLAPGRNEAITSPRIAERFADAAMGERLKINNVDFEVVGHFEADGGAAESEVWTDIRDLTTVRRMQGYVSSVTFRTPDKATQQKLIERITEDELFNLKAMTEPEFFQEQMQSAQAIRGIGMFIALFLTIGAMFGAANTMYAAVAGRAREIGTLRALGFGRGSILFSFMLESVLLCLIGGLIGCLAVIPFNGYSTGMVSFQTFSEISFSFSFGPKVLLQGVLMALVMGTVGGLFPAIRAVRLNVLQALREV